MKYLYLDTETGGVNPTTDALLTIGLVAHDDTRGILGTEHILVQPEGRAVHVKALAVNHINSQFIIRDKPGVVVPWVPTPVLQVVEKCCWVQIHIMNLVRKCSNSVASKWFGRWIFLN